MLKETIGNGLALSSETMASSMPLRESLPAAQPPTTVYGSLKIIDAVYEPAQTGKLVEIH